jgi:hypothetical protein
VPPTRTARLEALPDPYGVVSVSPCTTRTWSTGMPSCAATSWAIAVSLPVPGLVTPVSTVACPLTCNRTVVVS